MKTTPLNYKPFILLLLILLGGTVNAQKGQDPVPISAEAKRMLTHLVDSLIATQPDIPGQMRALPQAQARYVSISGPQATEAAAMLATQPTWDAFIQAFPPDHSPDSVLVAKYGRFQGSPSQQNILRCAALPGEFSYEVEISKDAEQTMSNLAGKWVFQFVQEKNSTFQITKAFYFLSDLENPALPQQYAAQLQYVDLLVNPSDSVYLPGAKNGHPEYELDSLPYWTQAQKKAMLQQCRSLKVVSDCMDGGPRSHYTDITILAAETGNWSIFIRSYLDLMNGFGIDHDPDFGNDAASEKGFLQGLASLHVEILDLATGMLLSSQDRPGNHFIASSGALGDEIRILDKRRLMERRIEKMILDEQLDLVNRIRIYTIYYWYLANDNVMTDKNTKRLSGLRKTLPAWLPGYQYEQY